MCKDINEILEYLDSFSFSEDLEKNIFSILQHFEKESTFTHLKSVANKASEIAEYYDVDKDFVYKAAILHDISAVVPNNLRVDFAEEIGISDVFQDDRDNPIMLHGKISAGLFKRYFLIDNKKILDAMRYHTTLCPNADIVTQIVFIADKIAIDPTEMHNAEYLANVVEVIDTDITKSCWYYLDWMFTNLEKLGWKKHYDVITAYE